VDITIIQEFVPTAKRGWLTGLTTTMLPARFLLGALLSAFAPSTATCSSIGIFHPCEAFGHLRSATEVRQFQLSRRELGVVQIGIGQVGAVELCQAQIRATQIGATQ
jgi:hypothetical protein